MVKLHCKIQLGQKHIVTMPLLIRWLLHMLHHWTKGCDGNGATVRITLYDYKKAFDFIDHKILVRKLCNLDLPIEIINWIIDF